MNRLKRATMTDVAKKAGVSQTTVSFVLNDIDAGLPERTKQRVLLAAKELNYSPNDAARRLASQKSRTLGLAIYDISDILDYEQATASVLASVYRAAERKAQRLAIYTTHERMDTGEDLETYFAVPIRSRQVDGVIVWDHFVQPDRLLSNFHDGLPVVTLDRQVDEVPCVVPDYDFGVDQVLRSLVEKGHQRFGLITHAEKVYRDLKILSAFDKTAWQLGIPKENITIKEERIPRHENDTIVEDLIDQYLQMPNRPTAIVCCFDRTAVAALLQLRTRGVKVPEEMALVGCAGLPITAHPAFQITTLDLRQDLIGSHAVNLVLQMVKGERLSGTCVMVQPQLIERSTT